MGTYNRSVEPLTILRQGIVELSKLNTTDQVLHYALNLSLLIVEGSKGYIMKRIVGDTWEMEGHETIQISPDTIERLYQYENFPVSDELSRCIPDDIQGDISRVIPIKVDGTLIAVLLLEDKRVRGLEHQQDAFLTLISQYVSTALSNIQLKEAIRELRVHYEDIIVKKETAEKLASLGTVAAGLAHEIKNPLVSIKTLAQLLPERFDDPEFRDHFTSIAITEVDRIGHIVSDLLDFAKSSASKFEALDMERFIENIIHMLSSQFNKKGIVVVKRFAAPLPLIYADLAQLKQILLNLFINSIDAMPLGGEIIIEAGGSKDVVEGERIIVKVTDTGVGIQEEDKPHLFEPFFTTKTTGTGLGLSICRRIIEKHQGEIYVESEYNKGTTVTLILPAYSKGES